MPTTHPPLRAGAIVRRALATYRAQFQRVAGAALIVLVPLGLLDTLAQRRLEEVRDDLPDAAVVSLLLFATITTIGAALGSTFFAGLLDKLVGEHQHGHARLSLGRVLATLPYGRLLVANVLLLIVTTAGALLLVVPGVLAYTLFSLVGPLINMEDHSVTAAFRRSARLVRPYLWTVALLVTLPAAAEEVLDDTVHGLLHHENPLLVALVLNGLLAATIGAVIGLIEVTLAYELAERHPAVPSRTGSGHHSGDEEPRPGTL